MKKIWYGPYRLDLMIWAMLFLIPFERYVSIPFCGPYFLVGRNLRNQHDPFYETDRSANSEIPKKA